MKAIKRRRLGKQAWSDVMRRFEGAGATVSQFCVREGLSAQSFYRWRQRLAVDGQEAASRAQTSALMRQRPSEAGSFIELGELPGAQPALQAGGALELRLDLGGGVVLQIVRR